jgi:lysophospholipase L1-like esterase
MNHFNLFLMRPLFIAFIVILEISASASLLIAQDDPFEMEQYAFVNPNLNRLELADSALAYQALFSKLTDIGLKGKGKVSIVHIGDSHLQADFFSGFFRKRLQTFFLGAMGGRGFIFPYKVAETNNPINYTVSSTGSWESCRNVEKKRTCELGLSGIAVNTRDCNATITIKISDPKQEGYDFDKLMVFHCFGNNTFELGVKQANKIRHKQSFPQLGYTLFEFSENLTTVTLTLSKTSEFQQKFTLLGVNFDSNDSGIIYHTIGVNGATFESFLSCKYFKPNLSALNPDWVIVSLGTNDSYTNIFDTQAFGIKVDSLIVRIQQAAPHAAILLTTPGDHRIKKSAINESAKIASDILKQKAQAHHISYWDFYSVMGGAGSIDAWRYFGMAHTDFLHLTQKGYTYQGQLLFNAFLKSYDSFLTKEMLTK